MSFAQLQLKHDLDFSDTIFGLGAGIFSLGYVIFGVPSNLMLARVGARVAGRDHGRLGPDLGVDGVHHGPAELLRAALPARRRRGRLLPRDHPLPQWWFPSEDRRGAGPLPHRHVAGLRGRRPARGRPARAATAWPGSTAGSGSSWWRACRRWRWGSSRSAISTSARPTGLARAARSGRTCPERLARELRKRRASTATVRAPRSSAAGVAARVVNFILLGAGFGLIFSCPTSCRTAPATRTSRCGLLAAVPFAIATVAMLWVARRRTGAEPACRRLGAGSRGHADHRLRGSPSSCWSGSPCPPGVALGHPVFWTLPRAPQRHGGALAGIARSR